MIIDRTASADSVNSALQTTNGTTESLKAGGVFHVICRDAEGNLKWETESHNLVVNVGLQYMNATFFSGASYNAVWYLGLWGAAASNNPAAGDTMASHAGWTEYQNYVGSRPTITFLTPTTANPSVVTSNSVSITISGAGGTVGGAFLTTNNTKGGTTGTLFSGSDFGSPGDRAVVSGDVLVVTYTFNLAAL